MVTLDEVRQFAVTLPRSKEALVRHRVKFRVGRIVYLAFSRDESVMGFAHPKEEREWLVGGDPTKFQLPPKGDLRYNWVEVRLAAIDPIEMQELVLDAWRMVAPRRTAEAFQRRLDRVTGKAKTGDDGATAHQRDSLNPMTRTEGWSRMKEISAPLLERRTGAGVEEWNRRVKGSGNDQDEAVLRRWLDGEGVKGYPQQLLIFERFGYPDYLAATADELIDAQYADRPQLRPILDGILAVAAGVGEVRVQARKGYVTLVSPRRTFALICASTKKRVDLGFRLDAKPPLGRLRPAGSMPQGWAKVKFELGGVADIDREVLEVLTEAYQANL